VFNTTDEQTKILNDIISDESHRDAEEYKSCGGDIVSWGGMKTLLNEGHLSTTNNASKKRLKDNVVNFYLKNCLSTHGLLKCGQETSQGNFFFFTTYLYQTLLQEKNENINCRGKYSFKSVEDWINNLINDTNLAKLFIPINIDNIHWVLIVVDIIQRSIHYYDSCHAEKDEQIQRLKNIERFMDDFETKKRSSEKKSKWSLHLNDGETP
jgi:Ulp1 family protease